MPEYTTDEALAFISAMRLAITGKVGFKWHVERLSQLADFIESLSAENDELRARLASANEAAGGTADTDTSRIHDDAAVRRADGDQEADHLSK